MSNMGQNVRSQRLFYSNEIGNQLIDEMRKETMVMRAEFTRPMQQLMTLLEQAIRLGMQAQTP